MTSDSFVVLDSYRKAASQESGWNYKGLTIHALPAIHEHVGKLVSSSLAPGASVLDLACGSGSMCQRLLDLGMRPIGCDLVPENFRLHGRVEFLNHNLNERLPAALEGAFDCVMALELIEHLENPRHLLRQCFRALKPGGLLIVSTPNIEHPLSLAQFVRTGEYRWFTPAHYRNDGHLTPLSLSVLGHGLEECGFTDVRVDSVGTLCFPGLVWWKMRLFAWLLKQAAGRSLHEGDILVCSARHPAARAADPAPDAAGRA